MFCRLLTIISLVAEVGCHLFRLHYHSQTFLRAGMDELVKCGMIADSRFFEVSQWFVSISYRTWKGHSDSLTILTIYVVEFP